MNTQPIPPIKDVERNITLTLKEAGFGGIMVNIATGVLLIKLALELGATGLEVGLLGAFPFMCQFAQIPAVMAVSYFGRRKFVGLTGSLIYRMSFFGTIMVPFFFEAGDALKMILVFSFFQHLGGGFSSGVWNGWIRALIPKKRLGSVFGNRMFYYTLAGTIMAIVAAIVVDSVTAYDKSLTILSIQACFAVGLVSGLISFIYYAKWPDVPASTAPATVMLKEFVTPLKDKSFRRLIAFLFAMLFAFNLAVPFFTVVMLNELKLPVSYVMGLWALGQFLQVPFFRWWGNIADRFSHSTSLGASLPFFIVALFMWPLAGLSDSQSVTIGVLIFIHILMGVGLSGVILSSQVIALKLAPEESAASYMATSTMLSSLAAGIASIFGGIFVDQISGYKLSVMFSWVTPAETTRFVAYQMQNYDFLFVGSAILILLSTPLLAGVREEGKVAPDEIHKLMRARAMGMFRSFTTVAGLRQLTTYPLSRVVERRRNHKLRRLIGKRDSFEDI